MPKGIPNPKPIEDQDAELAKMIADEAAQTAKDEADRVSAEQLAEAGRKAVEAYKAAEAKRIADEAAEAKRVADEEEANAFALYEAVPAVKLVAMELLRNYRPAGTFEIVGYVRPAVIRKDAAGREYEAEAAQFISGEMAPPPQAGVGTSGKIWAGTIIRVPHDEGRTMRANQIAERSVDD
jgi:hypothetical protein